MSEIVGSRRGGSVVRWKDRVNEYMHERVADRGGGIELARIATVRDGGSSTVRQVFENFLARGK